MELLTKAPIILASNGNFGINTDILETNLINQIILLVGLFLVGKDFLSESLSQRQEEIIQGVEDSEKRLREAQDRLSEAKKQLAQARVIIDEIKKESGETKKALLDRDYAEAKNELERRFSNAATILKFRERQILSEIKQYVSVLALKLVVNKIEKQTGLESKLKTYLQESISMVGEANPILTMEMEGRLSYE